MLDLVARPEKRPGRLNFEAAERLLKSLGIERRPGFVADDFDAPLPEDFLIRSMPEP